MPSDNTLLTVAVIVTVVSVIGLFASFTSDLGGVQFGPNVTSANVTVTIVQSLSILFTNNTINFGDGSVGTSAGANLSTMGQFDNWLNTTSANVTSAFVLENIGNVNVSLYIKTNRNATEFIMDPTNITPPAGPQEAFRYMVRNCNALTGGTGSATSCRPAANQSGYDAVGASGVACTSASGFVLGSWFDVNKTTALGTLICNKFTWEDNRDELRVDINVFIPESAPSTQKKAIMTATAEAQI